MRMPARVAAVGVPFAAACAAILVYSGHAAAELPPAQPAEAAPLGNTAAIQVAVDFRRYRDGLSTGPAFDAYYGVVQVQAVIRSGRVVAVNVLRHPYHSATSRAINRLALPVLEQEVIRAQSAEVHAVSGATLTSDAFIRSMNEALRQASG